MERMGMAERKRPAARKQSASARKPSDAQVKAGRDNLARGRQKKQEMATEVGERDSAGERWSKLLDGTLTVQDLDNEELARMKVRGKDGAFNRGRAVPSHLAQQMQQEAIRRAQEQFRTAAPQAVKRLLEIANDPEVKDSDAIKALSIVLERALGRTPQEIRIDGANKFDLTVEEAMQMGVDRDMDDVPTGRGRLDGDS